MKEKCKKCKSDNVVIKELLLWYEQYQYRMILDFSCKEEVIKEHECYVLTWFDLRESDMYFMSDLEKAELLDRVVDDVIGV
jgi:hypothetical protein